MKTSFASDNFAGVLPQALEALSHANVGHARAYGGDEWTERAIATFKEQFGQDAEVFFVFNGTAANVLSLQACARSFEAVICSESAHIAVDECGAPERFTGCKLITIPHEHGKISPKEIARVLTGLGDQHHVQPRLISISQTTELGTVYSLAELEALSSFAKSHGLLLHMDGARALNAAASLGVPLSRFTRDVGVDVLSFGGTKAGLLGAEAVVFLNSALALNFKYLRKQSMQLASKMRFFAAQFLALFENDLGLECARHANAMARLLESEIRGVPALRWEAPVQANALFPMVPHAVTRALQSEFQFYVWKSGETHDQVRWMMSWDTTENEVRHFARRIREMVSEAL